MNPHDGNRVNRMLPQRTSGGKEACRLLFAMALVVGFIGCEQKNDQRRTLSSLIDGADSLQLQSLEGTGIYTDGWIGETATITLGNPGHARGLSVSGTNVQTGLKDETMILKLHFDGGMTDSVEIKQTGGFEEFLLMPANAAARDTLQFTLIASKSFVPAKLGTSQDDRTLSFRLNKIGIVDAPLFGERMPSSFEFPRKSEQDPLLVGVYKDGWFADSAVVTLYNTEGKSSVEIRGFFPPNIFAKIADLEIYAGSKMIVKQQLPRQNGGYFRIIVQLPEDQISSARTVLTLKPSGTFVPSERGINPDKRRISYQLQYVGLR